MAAQAIILYEASRSTRSGYRVSKIPESVWGCTGKDTLYKQVVASLLQLNNPNLIADNMLGQRLSAESKFAFRLRFVERHSGNSSVCASDSQTPDLCLTC